MVLRQIGTTKVSANLDIVAFRLRNYAKRINLIGTTHDSRELQMTIRRSARVEKRNQIETAPVVVENFDKIDGNNQAKKKTTKLTSNSKKKVKYVVQSHTSVRLLQNITCETGKKPDSIEQIGDLSAIKSVKGNTNGLDLSKEYLNQPRISPGLSIPESTTDKNVIGKAIAHLAMVEPKLKPVIDQNPCHLFSPEGLAQDIEPFKALTISIISQQISGAAANSIKNKFVALFNMDNPDATTHVFPTSSQVSALSIERLRTAGLTQRKSEYVKGLAAKFDSGELNTTFLKNASYTELFDALIKVRGLGKWSIEMFACFGLKRLDIFSTQDIGIQRGMAILLGRDVVKLKKNGGKWKYISENEMELIANKFKPYRSIYMWYVWRIEETLVHALES